MESIQKVLHSVLIFFHQMMNHTLHLEKVHLGETYLLSQNTNYEVFRVTHNSLETPGQVVTLIVGFRLKLLRENELLHWILQRLCIFTTPFWSGFKGLGTKLWLVDPVSKKYAGIYEWSGEKNAREYLKILIRILHPLCIQGSVWYQVLPHQDLASYLYIKRVNPMTPGVKSFIFTKKGGGVYG